jgi:geranylgeranyl reductase family protein
MSQPSPLPTRCDVLVIGAGPAGSAAAWQLASRGLDVVLADQHAFPRDKVCGDGLIPDAHAAFQRLGVYDEVMAAAQPVGHVTCVAPRGGRVHVPGRLAVLPRKVLDDILLRASLRAGARLLPPARFEQPLEVDGRVVGARLRIGDATHALRARWVVLATGAGSAPLLAAGLCERRAPSAMALRGYIHHPGMVGRIDTLQIVWHRRLSGGYGWIFPAPGGVFNIGAGRSSSQAADDGPNLRGIFDAFCEVHPDARELVAGGTWVGELKGAPLRCSLDGSRWTRPGLLATGEAIGSTYAFTGEGIGKAMETGLLAAEAVLDGSTGAAAATDVAVDPATDAHVREHYEAALRRLKPKLDLYARAEHINRLTWITDLVVWRARRSPRILRRMTGVLEETQNPGRALSLSGLYKLMVE